MNDDKFLRDLMVDYQPRLSSDDAFMHSLERRLELIELVKAYQTEDKRQYRRASIITFAVGLVLGSIITTLSVLLPNPAEALLVGVKSKVLILLFGNIHYVVLAVGVIIMCGGLAALLKSLTARPQAGTV